MLGRRNGCKHILGLHLLFLVYLGNMVECSKLKRQKEKVIPILKSTLTEKPSAQRAKKQSANSSSIFRCTNPPPISNAVPHTSTNSSKYLLSIYSGRLTAPKVQGDSRKKQATPSNLHPTNHFPRRPRQTHIPQVRGQNRTLYRFFY